MVVNSINFLFFFIVVFAVYFTPIIRRNSLYQNSWLFLASYFFYGCADWRMIPLLLGATIIFYYLGKWLKSSMNEGKKTTASLITTFGVILGVGILLYFKYLNFFAQSFADLLNACGLKVTWTTLNIVLPVGVSFFTFKLISYLIEMHREKIEPAKNFIEFATYISFFPTILSGPIDRPNTFLPQLRISHSFDYSMAVDGCRQILWGMFTKMCIADNIALVTDNAWANYSSLPSSTLLVAALLYPIQMYTDFDGYSNMAIGVSKILGFRVTKNFNHPLISRTMAEYWRRWHMSLTSWITDYVFMPLNISFRNWGNWGVLLAITINLVVIGLWHGANWTYGLFGLYHSLLFIPIIFSGAFGKNKKIKENKYHLPFMKDFLKMVLTYLFITIGLIIFVAPNIMVSFDFFSHIFSSTLFVKPEIDLRQLTYLFIMIVFVLDWFNRKRDYSLSISNSKLKIFKYKWVRFSIYLVISICIIMFSGQHSDFIYFQF